MQYVRDRKNRRVGVLVAVNHSESPTTRNISIGWSLANRTAGDKFGRARGYEIALGRALNGTSDGIPVSVMKQYDRFCYRVKSYFKG